MIRRFDIGWIFTTRNRGRYWLIIPRKSASTSMRCKRRLKLLMTFSVPFLDGSRRCAKFRRCHQPSPQGIETVRVGVKIASIPLWNYAPVGLDFSLAGAEGFCYVLLF